MNAIIPSQGSSSQRGWTSREREELRTLYSQGYTARQMSDALKRSLDSINKALGRYELRKRHEKSAHTRTLTKVFMAPGVCPHGMIRWHKPATKLVSGHALVPTLVWRFSVLKR